MRWSLRDYNDPQYKQWRRLVKIRDKYKCRMPNCNMNRKLHVHHIKRWADFPTLRFDINNGITLCKKCHFMVTGNEDIYEFLFTSIVNNTQFKDDSYERVLRLMRDARKQ